MSDSVLQPALDITCPDPESRIPDPAASLLTLTGALLTVGAVMVFSTATQIEPPRTAIPWWTTAAVRQTVFSAMALLVMLAVSRIDYRFWRGRTDTSPRYTTWLLLVTLILLAAVLVPGIGVERNGARRWLNLGAGTGLLSFQPSELAKPALVLFLAAYLSARRPVLSPQHSVLTPPSVSVLSPQHLVLDFPNISFLALLPALLILAACVALVGFEDFGTAALLATVGGAMLWSSAASRRQLSLLAIPAALAMLMLVRMKGYRQGRLTGFLHVWDDPAGKGYHQYQSLIAIASGGWRGQGLGAGIQKYGYLPEARSDFVFGVICEELGILGGAAVLALYVALIWQGGRAARRAPDEFGRLLALGGTLMIGIQAMINVGVVTVSFPTKGIALPFISAGGSGVLFLGFLAGLIASVGRAPLSTARRATGP